MNKGFTMVELLITMTIIAILAAIAVPAYNGYVQKARRSEAFEALHQTINAMEKYKLSENTYPDDIATLNNVIKSHGLKQNGTNWESAEGNYRIDIRLDGDDNPVLARAVVQNAQLNDTRCYTMRLFLTGQKSASSKGSSTADSTDECWPD